MTVSESDFREQLRVGMPVVGRDGEKLGTIKEVLGHAIRVEQSLQRDIEVPFEAIATVTDDGVMLNKPSGAADLDTWDWDDVPETRPPVH